MTGPSPHALVILLRASSRTCALPLPCVIETLRPLPVQRIEGVPDFVAGMAIIRGAPTPVVDLGKLLGEPQPAAPSRFVTLRAGARTLALAVDEVLGVRDLDPASLPPLPPLLSELDDRLVERIGALDSELLLLLRAGRILPDELWPSPAPEDAPCP